MKKDNLYILDECELREIADLCDNLGTAINKIIRRRRLIRAPFPTTSAALDFRMAVERAELEDDEDPLNRLF